jgi:hypothetical protein
VFAKAQAENQGMEFDIKKSRAKQKKYPEERQVKVEEEKTTDMTTKECNHKTTQI